MAKHAALAAGFAASLLYSAVSGAIEFTEVPPGESGLTYVGETWGASWGDFNGDRYPDIFSSNHRERPSVWRNNGDGTFTDIVLQFDSTSTWLDFPFADTHAGAWGDFDNNGVQDLLVLSGASFPPYLYHNKGAGIAVDETTLRGFPDDAEGRTATWLDYDNDGELDVVINNRAPNQFIEQSAGNFADITGTVGLESFRTNFGILTDMDADNTLEFMTIAEGDFPEKVYKTDSLPFLDITDQFPSNGLVLDTAFTDFDNNLVPDILLVRGNLRPNQALKVTDGAAGELDTIEGWLAGGSDTGTRSIIFSSQNPIAVTLYTQLGLPKFNIGADGYRPIDRTFTLDPALAENQGIAEYDEAADQGFYIGYNTATGEWQINMSPGSISTRGYVVVEGVDLGDPTIPDLSTGDMEIVPKLFMNDGVSFTDVNGIGLSIPVSCVSVATGDFDNDMDQDIYMVCRNGIENIANKLYENLGDGTFQEAAGFGAEGVIGAGLAAGVGVGENVVTADYDLDGWLDLYVLNGLLMNPLRVGGPDQLFKNTSGETSTNRYLLLDLVGTVSSRDAIGAKVVVTAGGVTQLREMGGNYHRWAQNHQRLHVGLGQNDVADIEVIWPNGEVDSFTGVTANDLYEITQGAAGSQTGAIAAVAPTAVPAFPSPVAGDECGVRPDQQPASFEFHFDGKKDRGLFIWKDCSGTGEWYVRGTAGNANGIEYAGKLITNAEFSNVLGYGLEANNDVLDNSSPEVIDFFLRMSGGGVDGFDFTLPDTAAACLDMSQVANGAQVMLGQGHLPISTPINLATMATCIDIAAEDITAGEGDGSVAVTVSLSAPSTVDVTVDYALVSGTAEADSDFAAAAGTLTFSAGETSATVEVSLIQDALYESEESFTLELSNATGAFILGGQATITITDDESCIECGEPEVDATSEQAIFVWKDFDTGVWTVHATAGGDSGGVAFAGLISSTQAFESVVEGGLEASDTLDFTTSPDSIEYELRIWNSGVDAFQFVPAAGAQTCFTPTGPAGYPVMVGASKTAITGAFNLETMGGCLDLSVADISVSEGAGVASFTVTLTEPSTETVTVDYTTQSGSAIGDEDFVAVTTPQTLVFSPGETSKTIDVTLIDDAVDEGEEAFTVQLSNSVNATLSTLSAQATIVDNETNVCGAPLFDTATEQALFVWKDCDTGTWYVRNTAGGDSSGAFFEGQVVSADGFESIVGYSIENSDTLDNTTDPTVIDFVLKVWNKGEDGFDFKPVAEAGTCLNLDAPAGMTILGGADKQVLTAPFDLSTLAACTSIAVDISVSDAKVNEADGQVAVAVNLSVASGEPITVDYVTLGDSATGDEDYTEVTVPVTVTFEPGVTSQEVVIPILQDGLAEGSEVFTVEFSNAVNASLVDGSAEVTILDDEPSACGDPTFNSGSDQNAYLWKDCQTGTWHFAGTSGGSSSRVTYSGAIESSLDITGVAGNSVEGNDTLNSNASATIVDFILHMKGSGYDGFEFAPEAGASTCLNLDASSPGAGAVLVGADQTSLVTPLDLNTLQPCQ
ncbi:Calx-beta domain-containing protein [Halioxenophilus aromaticivorans]|uniref:Calx-beta domain-containing protein n=1 Tax=Halioxenophilus aromaticivorans TaxID=1306992 RepID=A0AAV3U1A1_9ALTE